MMYPLIGTDTLTSDFVLCLTDQIMKLPSSEEDEKKESADKYNPLYEYEPSMLQKIYNGTRQISSQKARIICSHLDKNRFTDFLSEFPDDVIELIHSSLQAAGRKFDNQETLDECANLFESILYGCAAKSKTRDKRTPREKALGIPKGMTLGTFLRLKMTEENQEWIHHSRKEPQKFSDVISQLKSRYRISDN